MMHKSRRHRTNRIHISVVLAVTIAVSGIALPANADFGPVDSPVDCTHGLINAPKGCSYDNDAADNTIDNVTQPASPVVNAVNEVRYASLSLTVGGSGKVTSSDGTINCGLGSEGRCYHSYVIGTPVVLTATPAPGAEFLSWWSMTTAGLSTAGVQCDVIGTTCIFEMTDEWVAGATFTMVSAPEPTPEPSPSPTSSGNNGKGPKK